MATTTLALNSNWDLYADASCNIATLSGGAQLAQDAASACRCFLGELYFDTSQGVPYWQQFLGTGTMPPQALIIAKLQAAAMTVPGAQSATVAITSIVGRTVRGTVSVTGTGTVGNAVTGTASF